MKLLITILAVTALLCISVALPVLAESPVTQAFDKEACYAKCACATGLFVACAECKAACDRTFWRVWEREMGNDTTSKKGDRKSQ